MKNNRNGEMYSWVKWIRGIDLNSITIKMFNCTDIITCPRNETILIIYQKLFKNITTFKDLIIALGKWHVNHYFKEKFQVHKNSSYFPIPSHGGVILPETSVTIWPGETQVVTCLCIQLSISQPVFWASNSSDFKSPKMRAMSSLHFTETESSTKGSNHCKNEFNTKEKVTQEKEYREETWNQWCYMEPCGSQCWKQVLWHITKWEENVSKNRNSPQISCQISDIFSLLLTWFLYDSIIFIKFK